MILAFFGRMRQGLTLARFGCGRVFLPSLKKGQYRFRMVATVPREACGVFTVVPRLVCLLN
jgi:hypothetical protein